MGGDQPSASCVTSLWSADEDLSASSSDIASLAHQVKAFNHDLISFTIPSTLSLLDEDEFERRRKGDITDSDSFTVSSLSDSDDIFLFPGVEMNHHDDDSDSFTTVTSLSDFTWDLFDESEYSSISSLLDIDADTDIDELEAEDRTCSDVEENFDHVYLSHIILDDIISDVLTNVENNIDIEMEGPNNSNDSDTDVDPTDVAQYILDDIILKVISNLAEKNIQVVAHKPPSGRRNNKLMVLSSCLTSTNLMLI